jgi:MYXO-CTERM domain-containing protein
MSDLVQDQPGAVDARDIVGDIDFPAGLRASDETNAYLRLRLEADPAPGGAVQASSWGMQFDTDGDRQTYELMILVEGINGPAGTVTLYRNSTTTLRNDPNDPVDQPPAQTYTFAANARTIVAPGSSFGGDPDYFLDFAVPWSALVPLGLDRDTTTYVWAATSSVADRLDSDFACHNGASGPVRLDGTASDPTTGDPDEDPNGGGGGTGRLEGGGGCSTGGGGGAGSAVALLALLGLVCARRRR